MNGEEFESKEKSRNPKGITWGWERGGGNLRWKENCKGDKGPNKSGSDRKKKGSMQKEATGQNSFRENDSGEKAGQKGMVKKKRDGTVQRSGEVDLGSGYLLGGGKQQIEVISKED